MSDAFEGGDHVQLQPKTTSRPLRMRFTAASASTKNDGSMPYGSTLVSATVSAFSDGGTSSTALVQSVTYSSNTVTVYLTYSTAISDGTYHLRCLPVFSLSGSTLELKDEFDFDRVIVGDL